MQPDSQLIRRIKRHQNRDAANILVERYYREIYSYTYRQTADRELAMDITQEIFITILQGIGSFDEKRASFRTWAYRVASNKITDYYRSAAHKQKRMEIAFLSEEERKSYDGVVTSEYDNDTEKLAADVEELIIRRDMIRRVMAVVTAFDMEWVQIFQKKCFEEMTFLQIAEDLGISVNTVKTRFYSMLRIIRQEAAVDE